MYFIGTQAGSTKLSSDVTPYILNIECDDRTGTTIQTMEVDILPNQQPIITGYPAGKWPDRQADEMKKERKNTIDTKQTIDRKLKTVKKLKEAKQKRYKKKYFKKPTDRRHRRDKGQKRQ